MTNIDIDNDIEKDILENIDIDIDIDKNILENIDIDIDIDKEILENIDIDIDKEILENIDIDKISNQLEFGISNRASCTWQEGGNWWADSLGQYRLHQLHVARSESNTGGVFSNHILSFCFFYFCAQIRNGYVKI